MKQYGLQTNLKKDLSWFQEYFDKLDWVESYEHYGEEIPKITGGILMNDFWVKNIPIEMQDMKLRRFVLGIFKKYGIKTKDFRMDFFLVKTGGSMPKHKDRVSSIAFLLPLSKNTGWLGIEDEDGSIKVLYDSMFILNTKKTHWGEEATQDRLLFRIAVHDFPYESIKQ